MLGITGSAGKTTVKDLIAAMLSQRGATCATRGNWNNFIGLPLSMLAMQPEDDFGVFELGMNAPGEIAGLSDILSPVAGLITSIGEAHLEKLGSVENIAHEKASLLRALPEEGLAVLDADSPWFTGFRADCACRVVTCALDGEAEVEGRFQASRPDELEIRDHRRHQRFRVRLPLPGEHMCRNLLQSVTWVLELGLSPDEIREGILSFAPPPQRWQEEAVGGFRVINDAYNANPLSMRSSIQTFAQQERPVEKWLVLGAMNELGAAEEDLHREVGRFLNRFVWAGVICLGPRAAWMAEEARQQACAVVDNPEQAAVYLREHAGPGSGVLLKGSRSEKIESVLEFLCEKPKAGGES
jgi:UDP-N-acetylmuramoyl-tripeptide--D-alanyl-D-alanine ligase